MNFSNNSCESRTSHSFATTSIGLKWSNKWNITYSESHTSILRFGFDFMLKKHSAVIVQLVIKITCKIHFRRQRKWKMKVHLIIKYMNQLQRISLQESCKWTFFWHASFPAHEKIYCENSINCIIIWQCADVNLL